MVVVPIFFIVLIFVVFILIIVVAPWLAGPLGLALSHAVLRLLLQPVQLAFAALGELRLEDVLAAVAGLVHAHVEDVLGRLSFLFVSDRDRGVHLQLAGGELYNEGFSLLRIQRYAVDLIDVEEYLVVRTLGNVAFPEGYRVLIDERHEVELDGLVEEILDYSSLTPRDESDAGDQYPKLGEIADVVRFVADEEPEAGGRRPRRCYHRFDSAGLDGGSRVRSARCNRCLFRPAGCRRLGRLFRRYAVLTCWRLRSRRAGCQYQ